MAGWRWRAARAAARAACEHSGRQRDRDGRTRPGRPRRRGACRPARRRGRRRSRRGRTSRRRTSRPARAIRAPRSVIRGPGQILSQIRGRFSLSRWYREHFLGPQRQVPGARISRPARDHLAVVLAAGAARHLRLDLIHLRGAWARVILDGLWYLLPRLGDLSHHLQQLAVALPCRAAPRRLCRCAQRATSRRWRWSRARRP